MSVVKSNETMGQNNQLLIDVFIAFKFIFSPTQFDILNKLLTIVIFSKISATMCPGEKLTAIPVACIIQKNIYFCIIDKNTGFLWLIHASYTTLIYYYMFIFCLASSYFMFQPD